MGSSSKLFYISNSYTNSYETWQDDQSESFQGSTP